MPSIFLRGDYNLVINKRFTVMVHPVVDTYIVIYFDHVLISIHDMISTVKIGRC